MPRRIMIALSILCLALFLVACDQMQLSDYQIWRNSEDSEDLNGDRKIDELDYEIYLNQGESDYEVWRDSEDAEDLNGDRKIDEQDYELYLNPPANPMQEWLLSKDAVDYNDDDLINEEDYEIYLDYQKFAGSYKVTNYVYDDGNTYVGNDLKLSEFNDYLDSFTIVVDDEGNIDVSMTNELIIKFGDTLPIILEALENMTIERISPFIVAIDTKTTIDSIEVSVSLYLTEIEDGFSVSYAINYESSKGTLSFDLLKETDDATD